MSVFDCTLNILHSDSDSDMTLLTVSERSWHRWTMPPVNSGSCMDFTVRHQPALSVKPSSLLVR